jgi:S-formylglutathione hydrolase
MSLVDITEISVNKIFGGWHKRFSHYSLVNQCDMTFAIYLPPQVAQGQKVPVLYWLSGLTCNDENFSQKAGAQRIAAELGIALVMPDTSPRGDNVPDDENASYDLGLGAGFYLNALQTPWQQHYQMYDYVTQELPLIIRAHFPVTDKKSISGHSMGGHGALTIGLKNASQYCSVSAFSPIVNPISCPWGEKAFNTYLGSNKALWQQYDSCYLLANLKDVLPPVLIDQGLDDNFLDDQLLTNNIQAIADEGEHDIKIRMQPDYDHSYFFIASFIEEHLVFHARHLK